MPVSEARPSFGAKFGIGDAASPEVFTELYEILGLPGIGTTHRTAEVTHFSSPNGFAEHIGIGVKDLKAFTLQLNFIGDDVAQMSLFQTRVDSGTKNNYKVVFTDAAPTSLVFSAIVQDITIDHELSSQAILSVTFMLTGQPTWGTGAL